MKLKILSSPNLSWTDNHAPKSEVFADSYCSDDNTLAEIDYVFIQHNQLVSRFQESSHFCLAETSFGTGLNFLRIVQLWLKNTKHQDKTLHFISFEKHPLSKEELQKLHQRFPELNPLSKQLLDAYPCRLPGWHSIELFNKQIKLTLWLGDVLQALPEMDFKVDAWVLNGFAPFCNEQLWQPRLYSQMARLSHEKTTFATFNVTAEVQRGLQKAGFQVQKIAGFKNKPEICFGHFVQPRPNSPKAPWFSLPNFKAQTKTAIIIGAGLAGATVAYQLAIKGWKVTVLEKNVEVSKEASGNLAGAIHPLVTADWNLPSQWYLKGFETTLKWLKPWLDNKKVVGNLNGLIHLATTETIHNRMLDSIQRVGIPNDFAQWKTAEQIAPLVGCSVNYPGLFFPSGGWVQPASIVQTCLSHPNIQCITQTEVSKFSKQENLWQVQTKQEQCFQADILIVATAGLDEHLNHQLDLPIRPVKGQVTHLKNKAVFKPLNMIITHKGYSVSLDSDTHITGATFEAPCMKMELSSLADEANLTMAKDAIPSWIKLANQSPLSISGGKIGFRPTTPDHLPIIGPVANPNFLSESYLTQSHTHAVYRYPEQQYQQGLYVSNGHGARGLMSVFLAAEMISEMIHQQPLNLPSSLYHATHPARFKIRSWRKGNIRVRHF